MSKISMAAILSAKKLEAFRFQVRVEKRGVPCIRTPKTSNGRQIRQIRIKSK